MDQDFIQKNGKIALLSATALLTAGYLYKRLSLPQSNKKNETDTYHIGIETGGTSCKVGIMKDPKSLSILRQKIIKTRNPKDTVQDICDYINQQPETFSSLGVAAFGPLCLDKKSKEYGSITTTPKIEWQNTPLLSMLLNGISNEKKTNDFKVVFDTDCNILAKFELENGNHIGISDNIAYITVGTGVGVGLFVNGQYIHGLIHPEGGHVSVPKHPLDTDKYKSFKGVCAFHQDRCVEGLCTNVAIAQRLSLDSVEDVAKLADDHEVWEIIGYYLGIMCANLTLTLSVEKIVLGGGVIMRGEVLMQKISSNFLKAINGYLKHQNFDEKNINGYIVRSKFENELGLVSSASVGSHGQVYGHKTSLSE